MAANEALSSPLVGEDSSPQKAQPIGEANLVRGLLLISPSDPLTNKIYDLAALRS